MSNRFAKGGVNCNQIRYFKHLSEENLGVNFPSSGLICKCDSCGNLADSSDHAFVIWAVLQVHPTIDQL